jgi:hypothetical protein
VYIGFNGKKKYLGIFVDEITAAKRYNYEALKIHGEFANINVFPEEEKPSILLAHYELDLNATIIQ